MSKIFRYSPELRERAMRMVLNNRLDYPPEWVTFTAIAKLFGMSPGILSSPRALVKSRPEISYLFLLIPRRTFRGNSGYFLSQLTFTACNRGPLNNGFSS